MSTVPVSWRRVYFGSSVPTRMPTTATSDSTICSASLVSFINESLPLTIEKPHMACQQRRECTSDRVQEERSGARALRSRRAAGEVGAARGEDRRPQRQRVSECVPAFEAPGELFTI